MNHPQEHMGSQMPAFSPADAAFIHRVFRMELVTLEDLRHILRNGKLRQPLLDSRRLREAIARDPEAVTCSDTLFYYVQLRQLLVHSDLPEAGLAEYLTSLVLDLSRGERSGRTARGLQIPHRLPLRAQICAKAGAHERDIQILLEVGTYRVVVEGSTLPTAAPSSPPMDDF